RHAEMLTDGNRFLDFFELALILKNARFIVGNDTGPTHLGAHLGVPGLAIFSSHLAPERTGIQYSRFTPIQCPDLQSLSLELVIEHLRAIFP
ncbi:MAG: glycosyltransferase family 9 protein, partial [Desulfobulbaceae bacterium]|nr:glycosyltransferase family 9 protein [Desulfobulbaceae bacterium]